MADRDGDGKEDQHRAAVGHELRAQEGKQEEYEADDIVVVEPRGYVGDKAADQIARAGGGKGAGHGQCADDEQQHAQRDRTHSLVGLEDTADHHQHRAGQADLPDGDTLHNAGLQHEGQGCAEEDDDARDFGEGRQRYLIGAAVSGPHHLVASPIGAEARHDKGAVEHREDQHGQAGDHRIQEAHRRNGAGVALELFVVRADVAAELGGLGRAGADGQCGTGGDGDDSEGKRDLRPGNARRIGGGHTEWRDNAIDDDGALHDLAQHHDQHAVEQQEPVAIPLDDARDTGGEPGAEFCLVEADGHYAHRSDHDDDVVGEAGEDLLLWEAACERKRRDGGHGDRGEAPDIRNVARAGQNEQDQADAQVIGHCLFPS